MKCGITDAGFERLARKFVASFLNDMLSLVRPHVYWRIQPKDKSIQDYKSIGYNLDISEEIEGVWAFVNLENALRDLYALDSGYAGVVESGGGTAELVAIEATFEDDGPEDSVIIYSGDIIGRFDVRSVIEDSEIRNYLIDEGWLRSEDYD